jgi:nuclear receptor co-repressor 1
MGTVPSNFVSASFAAAHGGFAPRVSVSIPQQPPTQQQQQPSQSVPGAPRQLTEYIAAGIRDSATTAALLQASQTNLQRPQPDPGGTQQQQQQAPPSAQPAYKKIRLGEPYQPQTNSLHHPAAAPTSIPVRLHHAPSYDKTGQQIQSSGPVVVQVASTPRIHQNPIVGATAEIQYQPQKPPQQQPTHQIPTAASPQAPQSQSQQQPPPSQQSQQQQQQQQPASTANSNQKVLSVLKIDTRDPLITGNVGNVVGSASSSANNNSNNGGYHPKTEAISPAGSPKLSKDDLLQQISSVDSSMMSLEERKRSLKEKERTLLEQKDEGMSIEVPEQPTTHRTLAQQIYAENKKKANDSHAILTALNFKGLTYELPLYNQPSDADVCRKIHEHYLTFRSSLLLHLRKIKSERAQRNQELADKYAKLSADWQKRVEKIESSIKRKNREFKNRELFEKVFVELKKQREDKERFNRVGSRADFAVIVDGLQEQVNCCFW